MPAWSHNFSICSAFCQILLLFRMDPLCEHRRRYSHPKSIRASPSAILSLGIWYHGAVCLMKALASASRSEAKPRCFDRRCREVDKSERTVTSDRCDIISVMISRGTFSIMQSAFEAEGRLIYIGGISGSPTFGWRGKLNKK